MKHCRPDGLCCNYLNLLLQNEGSHKQYEGEWAWLSSNKTLLTKVGSRSDWASDHSLLTLALTYHLVYFCHCAYHDLKFFLCIAICLPLFFPPKLSALVCCQSCSTLLWKPVSKMAPNEPHFLVCTLVCCSLPD